MAKAVSRRGGIAVALAEKGVPVPAEFCTSHLSAYMKKTGGSDPSFRGLSNCSVMSRQLQLYFIYLHFSRPDSPMLRMVSVDTSLLKSEVLTGGDQSLICSTHPERRVLVRVNDRHIVTARLDKGSGYILVRDTSMVELRPAHERLMLYLNESQCLSPTERHRVIADTRTPQQPVDCGGCCVMSLANMDMEDWQYATVQDGERLRKAYGERVVRAVMRGMTPRDMELMFWDYVRIQHLGVFRRWLAGFFMEQPP